MFKGFSWLLGDNQSELSIINQSHCSIRQDAIECLESEKELKPAASGGSIYWSLVSRTFLKKLLPSHSDEKDVICNDN